MGGMRVREYRGLVGEGGGGGAHGGYVSPLFTGMHQKVDLPICLTCTGKCWIYPKNYFEGSDSAIAVGCIIKACRSQSDH